MSRIKPILIRVLLLALGIELASFAGWFIIQGEAFRWSRADATRTRFAASYGEVEVEEQSPEDAALSLIMRIRDQALHPYVGFVFDPSVNSPSTRETMGGREVTRYGFIGTGDFFEEPAEDRIVIGITGGSVAAFFSTMGASTLIDELHTIPELANKEIVFVTMALLGYKQPQQLFALQYALTLGAHFDWIINLDGFNEVTLGPIENEPKGVAAIYPRSWYWRVKGIPSGETRRLMGQVAYLEERRAGAANDLSNSALRWSPTANLIWLTRNASMTAEIGRAERALIELAPTEDEASFQASGPFNEHATEAEMYVELAEIWMRSGLQMHRVCEANGIRYWHFLQPNQYVPESKPMGAEELAQTFVEASPFRAPVLAGYPLLQAAGAELRAQGVHFHDLTEIFGSHPEPLYIDTCCHLGEAGNRILASHIAQAIRAELKN